MINIGDIPTGSTIYIPFNTYDSDGASITVTDLVAGDVKIHKDGGLTQRSSANGITVAIDFDGITGNHLITIDLSDNTDAGFYAIGSDYKVRLEGITVDTQTINAWVGIFSIQNRFMRGTDSAALAAALITHDGKIGTPVNIDSGGATIADNIKKLADNNDGADFEASTDSLERLRNTVPIGTTMRGTDNAALASALSTHDGKLDGAIVDLDAILANTRILSFRKNTALNNAQFAIRDANGDPVSGESVAAQRILDGGSVESMDGAVAEVGTTGVYRINYSADDVNCDFGSHIFTPSAGKARVINFMTVL